MNGERVKPAHALRVGDEVRLRHEGRERRRRQASDPQAGGRPGRGPVLHRQFPAAPAPRRRRPGRYPGPRRGPSDQARPPRAGTPPRPGRPMGPAPRRALHYQPAPATCHPTHRPGPAPWPATNGLSPRNGTAPDRTGSARWPGRPHPAPRAWSNPASTRTHSEAPPRFGPPGRLPGPAVAPGRAAPLSYPWYGAGEPRSCATRCPARAPGRWSTSAPAERTWAARVKAARDERSARHERSPP
ncbi:hypothetical protein SHIRM173S_05766 [Streptomyces hirsutus]